MSPLACPVRGCGVALERRERTLACARGHCFDVARSGYINLLQPQDRRSPSAGDSKASLEARCRLAGAGIGLSLTAALVERVSALTLDPPIVVDLGSGTGEALAAVVSGCGAGGVGIDLSVDACEIAARRFAALASATWVVANADRRLPLLDGSVGLVLSIHARRNPAECARVLSSRGYLLAAIPAADDLVELRTFVQGERVERDRSSAVLEQHQQLFTLVDRGTIRERRPLGRALILDLLRGTYRGERRALEERVASLDAMEVTMASEWLLFALRPR